MSKKDAVDTIVKHKANKMKKGLDPDEEYNEHIKKVLEQLNINILMLFKSPLPFLITMPFSKLRSSFRQQYHHMFRFVALNS